MRLEFLGKLPQVARGTVDKYNSDRLRITQITISKANRGTNVA